MSLTRARVLRRAVPLVVAALGLAACSGTADASSDAADVTLTVGFQTADYPELLAASGLFEDLPYTLDTPVIAGPAAQISALYSKATDIGLVGENTAAFEAANEDEPPGEGGPKIYTIAGVSYPGTPYPAPTVFVRAGSGIETIEDLRGRTVAYNFGGNIYAAYVKVLADAGLTVDDIEPVQLPDNQAAAASFVAGQVDAVVSSWPHLIKLVDAGEAVPLVTNEDIGLAGGAGFITRPDVLDDPAKLETARDFVGRLGRFYAEWYPEHHDEVVGIYTDVLKQSPQTAEIQFEAQRSGRLYRVGDPDFAAREQAIVEAAHAAGGVKHAHDVSAVFNPVFDDVAVP